MPHARPTPRDQFVQTSATILSAMANAARMSILTTLLTGEISVGALSVQVGLSQSALSQHLSKLRGAGLVSSRREAQTIYYRCDSEIVRQVLATLSAIFPPATRPAEAA